MADVVDYVCCNECGKKLFYDGEWVARDYMRDTETTGYVTCEDCVKKLKKSLIS